VTKAKAKIQQLQNDRDAAESFGWQVTALLQAMAPHSDTNRVTAAMEAWQAAGRRSALFQKTGQELGLTDSASPEQILQRAQEVAMILRSRSQAQDFDANLLAMLGLPANASRDAVLDAVKKLVAFRDGRATIDDFTKHPLLSLSELPVGTKCVAAGRLDGVNPEAHLIVDDEHRRLVRRDLFDGKQGVGAEGCPLVGGAHGVLSNAINK